jgi:hypothetical protein
MTTANCASAKKLWMSLVPSASVAIPRGLVISGRLLKILTSNLYGFLNLISKSIEYVLTSGQILRRLPSLDPMDIGRQPVPSAAVLSLT